MKKRCVYPAVIVLLFFVLLPAARCDIWEPFHTKEEKINMWIDLWNAHPNTMYSSVGKTYNGKDIWLFTAGNVSGQRVLWDGELHGNEDKGSEILYLLAEWLLESNKPQATKILEENSIMFIPVVNDMDARGNGNTETSRYGVDLNRNFATGWTQSDPNSDLYSGAYAASEPETQVLRGVFSTYKPVFYVNMHCGGGPYAAYYNGGNQTLANQVITRTKTVAQDMGISPYQTRSFGSDGFAIGDAVALGVQSAWLIEAVGSSTAWQHLPEHYNELVNIYFPKCLSILIAMCELTSSATMPPSPQPIPSSTPYSTPEPTVKPTPTSSTPNSTPFTTPPTTPEPPQLLTPQSTDSILSQPSKEPKTFVYAIAIIAAYAIIGTVAFVAKRRR
jgi:hypothetical protein